MTDKLATLTAQQAIGLDESHLVEFVDCLGRNHQLNRAIIDDLQALTDAAAKSGVMIAIVSGYRSFNRQLAIWNEKWCGHRPVFSRHGRPLNVSQLSDIERYKAISLYSALPGLSRHHWGTDIDIFAAEAIEKGYVVDLTEAEFAADGPCAALESWLQEHLKSFGFFRPYREYRQGVSAEPWHISHITTASDIFNQFDFDACRQQLQQSDIKARRFIDEQFAHYRTQYFCNICEVN